MSFGFVRQSGSARTYINASNTDGPYAIGTVLSRRQYDKYVESLGKRQHLPAAETIRDTQRQLDQLRRDLIELTEVVTSREALVTIREQELELEKQLFRRARADAGQRRYNAVLESFVRTERARGRHLTKREAIKSPEFKRIMSDIKGHRNTRKNPNVRDRDAQARRVAFDEIGGGKFFKEQYQNLYGPTDGGAFNTRRGAQIRGYDQTGRSYTTHHRRRVA